MEKILTISIAAYNVEKYIRKALDSIVESKCLDEIEVFIVDDGGNDNTLSIAKEYAERFPNSFFPIHKENGGYGSTVNYSISNASGKYIKLMDGDDWYDSNNLSKLIKLLKKTDADVVVNDYEVWREAVKESVRKGCALEPNKKKDISKVKWTTPIGMWNILFKTDNVRASGVELPLHRLYTDQIFCTIPFEKSKSILYCNYPIYCYRVGRDGQSVSRESRIKHIDEALQNCYELAEFYERKKKEKNPNLGYFKVRISQYLWMGFHTILLLPVTKEGKSKAKEYDKKIQSISLELSKEITKMKGVWGKHIYLCRKTNYLAYWLVKLIPGGVKNWS